MCWCEENDFFASCQILSLPPSVIPVACIAIGYPAEAKEPRTRFNRDYVHFEKW